MSPVPPRDAEPDEREWFARWQGGFGCPPPELITPALERVLEPAMLAERVRSHVAHCGLCQTLADAEPEDLAPAEAARIRTRVFSVGRRPTRYRLYAVAAMLTVAVGGASIAWRVLRTPVAAQPPVRDAVAAPQPATPAFVLPLVKPATELPPESLTVRSGSADSYAAALENALKPYEGGNYDSAIAGLEDVARRYPGRPHPVYYLGLSRLFDGDAAGAASDLARAHAATSEGSSLSAETAWYLAVALERSGHRADAADRLAALCGQESERKTDACAGARALRDGR